MENDMMLPISVEKFAAYLDGNLSENEMNSIDALASTDPNLEELIAISDVVDEDSHAFQQDQFALDAELTALEDSDFDIPAIDADVFSIWVDDNFGTQKVAAVASEPEANTPGMDITIESHDNDFSSEEVNGNDKIPMDSPSDQSEYGIDKNHHDLDISDDLTAGDDFWDS